MTAPPLAERGPSIGLLACSAILDDPRVRRQGDAFHAAGWTVSAVGLAGGSSPSPKWPIKGPNPAGERGRKVWDGLPQPVRRFARPVLVQLSRATRIPHYVKARASLSLALRAYWSLGRYREIFDAAQSIRPDIWLANDWDTLPIAARLAAEQNVPIGYDTHEFAIAEYEERPGWRLVERPMIATIERHFIHQCALVSSVSPSISQALQNLYRLAEMPMTLVNAPVYTKCIFRETQEPARVLYHGIVAPGRGLEASIESVADWRNGRTLTIRGPAAPEYRSKLLRLSAKFGVSDRVALAPPVPMTRLVEEAGRFDIGLLALPGHSRHNQFALPNKLFEYTMAGLAICMTELPDISRIVGDYRLGVTFPAAASGPISAAINSLDASAIDAFKRNALEAARDLSWEKSASRLVGRYAEVVSGAKHDD